MRLALVLSGGGMFGAWQAGAWRALAGALHPDLVVGASVGSLNAWAIASGAPPEELIELWRRPEMGLFRRLPETIRMLMARYTPRVDYGAVLTDACRLRPVAFRAPEVTWRHLAASCAIPGVVRPYVIGGRLYVDGGLLDPVPLWAAAEMGATRIVALDALPEPPARWVGALVGGLRRLAGFRPAIPGAIEVVRIAPQASLGSPWDVLCWRRENIERWIAQGQADATGRIKHFL